MSITPKLRRGSPSASQVLFWWERSYPALLYTLKIIQDGLGESATLNVSRALFMSGREAPETPEVQWTRMHEAVVLVRVFDFR